MCSDRRTSLTRFVCLTFFTLWIVLSPGFCQNAEPRGLVGTRNVAKGLDVKREEKRAEEKERLFDWDASSERERILDKDERSLSSGMAAEATETTEETEAEVAPRADGNRNMAPLPPEDVAGSSVRRSQNVTASTSIGRRKGNGADRARKKRRRNKDSKITDSHDRPRGMAEDVRENEVRGNRGHVTEKRGGFAWRNHRVPQSRKFRTERRRRRKNRERKRGRKRLRQEETNEKGEEEREPPKVKRRMNDAPTALHLTKVEDRNRNGSSSPRPTVENFPYDASTSLKNLNRTAIKDELPLNASSGATASQNHQERAITRIDRIERRPLLLPRRGPYVENVERELSKQLEREIARTGLDDSSVMEDRILGTSLRKPIYPDTYRKEEKQTGSSNEVTSTPETKPKFGNSRYDAEKMLGYSRTEEDLPILDLENEVLERTLKDYNAYMTSSLRLSMLAHRDDDKNRRKSTPRSYGRPIISNAEWKNVGKNSDASATSTTIRTNDVSDEDNTRGDLSCINGTFLPAPLARHALIKYVKSSIPGHEYLEADYECAPGFYMASATSRLLCWNRQWVGDIPKCKVRQMNDGVCAEAYCEHVCKEIDGKAVCSCYKGFRLDGYKCIDMNECEENNGGCEHKCVNTAGSFRCECPKGMKLGEDRFTCTDINECHLNNGHGPCQDTCRNLVGGYECSCENLQETVLSPDNHTCQDAGPCSVNNAGCSHTCLSTMGRVFCLCPDGFMLEDDWKTCQDVDECAVPDLQTEVCRYGCINTPGSYRCAEPMELKDQPILDSLSITCLPGYEATVDGTCIDVNECAIDNGGCTEVCENTDGSFFCACDGDEKALSTDGKSCIDINNVACPPLNPAGRGYLMCSRLATPKPWRGRRRITNRPGTKCFLKCPHGYQLHGEYELTCRADGTWDGPKHGECVRYSKPRLECPKEVVAELPPGRDEAFVTFDQPSTDLDWFRYVRSKPSWGTRLEANLRTGVHEITFFARHPVSKKQASCVLRINVKGGEAPKVKDCPKDIEVTGKNGTSITWAEPIFTDNVKVTRIVSNESPGRPFDVGGHKIEYEASDEAGWSSKCVFTVVLRQE